MTRLFFGNFNFEHELAARDRAGRATSAAPSGPDDNAPGRRPSANDLDRQLHAALAAAWVAVAEPGDLVATMAPAGEEAFSDLTEIGWPVPQFVEVDRQLPWVTDGQVVPWGWSQSMPALAAERGWACAHPPLDVVRQVNSRRFRFELERVLDVALPGSAVAETIDDLRKLAAGHADAPLGWILKSNYGMAGRESIRGRGGILSESIRHWARRRIGPGGCVVFEPVVAPVAEAGIQVEIPERAAPALVGVTPLLVDRAGTYRGSRFGHEPLDVAPWRPAIETALRVARRIQTLGYFGPLGIDAMQYRTAEGELRLRPLQDLNARFTMGRLALGFERLVPSGWCASWLHAPRRAAAFISKLLPALRASGRGRARLVTTSPDGASAQHSMLLLAESVALREQLENDYLRACAAIARGDSAAAP